MSILFGTRNSSSAIALILVASTMAGLLVGVESILLLSPRSSPRPMISPLERKGHHLHHRGTDQYKKQCQMQQRSTSAKTITSLSSFPSHSSDIFGFSVSRQESLTLAPKQGATSTCPISTSTRYASRQQSSRVILQSSEKNDDNNNNRDDNDKNDSVNGDALFGYIGVASQPVVWASLYLVATTGGGFPAGPAGLLGALEGVSYLFVVAFALLPPSMSSSTAKNLSRITIGIGLVILAGLVANQGCVPNAKPILDYSAYLPICNSE